MSGPVRNVVDPAGLSEDDVVEALARIAARDADLERSADHAYEALTWGQGPGVLRQAGLQFWLWYALPTKYITDEVGYMGRLAQGAAALFDELGLNGYAAICRSSATAEVHAAYDRSDADGRRATGRAMEKSGIDPPDLADFTWSDFMGGEESSAHSAVEDALERAIAAGDVVVGGRGWRAAQAAAAAEALDGDHPDLPGQSWRTAVLTERLEQWVGAVRHHSRSLGSARAAVVNRLLHPVEPPSGVFAAVAPLVWLLDRHGDEQPLTQAGYLAPSFVRSLQDERPWELALPLDREMRTEGDDMVLLALREWLQLAGALRKRKSKLKRTTAGAAMAADPAQTWNALTRHLAPRGWEGFVAETVLLHLLDSTGHESDLSYDSVLMFVAAVAEDMGWTTTDDGARRAPSDSDVSWALFDIRQVWVACGLVAFDGSWRDRRIALTEAGEAAALSYLRHTATGPRTSLQ
ncbi:MAG: hypothetical protein OXT07_04455 [bacterium]|nr:hypothetical protein [bacterium]